MLARPVFSRDSRYYDWHMVVSTIAAPFASHGKPALILTVYGGEIDAQDIASERHVADPGLRRH